MTEFQVILRTSQLAKCISIKADIDQAKVIGLTLLYERKIVLLGKENLAPAALHSPSLLAADDGA